MSKTSVPKFNDESETAFVPTNSRKTITSSHSRLTPESFSDSKKFNFTIPNHSNRIRNSEKYKINNSSYRGTSPKILRPRHPSGIYPDEEDLRPMNFPKPILSDAALKSSSNINSSRSRIPRPYSNEELDDLSNNLSNMKIPSSLDEGMEELSNNLSNLRLPSSRSRKSNIRQSDFNLTPRRSERLQIKEQIKNSLSSDSSPSSSPSSPSSSPKSVKTALRKPRKSLAPKKTLKSPISRKIDDFLNEKDPLEDLEDSFSNIRDRNMKSKDIVIYTRSSKPSKNLPIDCDSEHDQLSTEEQEKTCRKQARNAGYNVVEVVTEIGTAFKTGPRVQKGLKGLIERISSGDLTVCGIMVFDTSRFSRNVTFFEKALNVLTKSGVAILCYDLVSSSITSTLTEQGRNSFLLGVTTSYYQSYNNSQCAIKRYAIESDESKERRTTKRRTTIARKKQMSEESMSN